MSRPVGCRSYARALLVAASSLLLPAAAVADPVPNLVFIMADDLGWSDTSNGQTNLGNPSSFYQTPTLERLAAEGMAFTAAYTNGPNCRPTRAAILTGHYAPRADNLVYSVASLHGAATDPLVGIEQESEIPNSAFTIADALKSAGYTTAQVGKYHAGDPLEQGFDFSYGGGVVRQGGSYFADLSGAFDPSVGASLDVFGAPYTQQFVDENVKPYSVEVDEADIDALVGTGKHSSDALADAAIDFMTNQASAPFFLHIGAFAVHVPTEDEQARPDLLAKYRALPDVDDDGDGAEPDGYAALIEGLDQSVARVVHHLEVTDDPRNPGKKLSENTLLIFYSDNGGREPAAFMGPLRGEKGDLTEGGIRVPMIAWSGNPQLVASGRVNATPVIGVDFYPTFAELAGASTSGLTLDGESLVPILVNAAGSLGRDAIYWHYPGYAKSSGTSQGPVSVIRQDDWKLVYDYEARAFVLYDLASDIGESVDASFSHPDVVHDLGMMLLSWLDDLDAPLATLRAGQDPISWSVRGFVYANGAGTHLDGETVTILPGEEVPLVVRDVSYAPFVWRFWGTAEGGSIDFEIGGVSLQVVTSAGDAPSVVASLVAAAINQDPVLSAAGISATAVGNAVTPTSPITSSSINDPGLSDEMPAVAFVPSSSSPGLAVLLAGLLASAAWAVRRGQAA